ncbi:hypothetical protein RHGRI_036955 [Rhododendron griersonianum]|uniref:ARM repeat superfamily protein n=1 Tax=Rhododendron griersonianum TaxID=479676 RepID=A0AAV6HTG9_9ERIC|nr:hypothetical protein RHGRI_036955 [Rhododendron griersonianum]
MLEEESDKIFLDTNLSPFQLEIDWESPPKFDEYPDEEEVVIHEVEENVKDEPMKEIIAEENIVPMAGKIARAEPMVGLVPSWASASFWCNKELSSNLVGENINPSYMEALILDTTIEINAKFTYDVLGTNLILLDKKLCICFRMLWKDVVVVLLLAYTEAFRLIMRLAVGDKSFTVRIATARCLKAFANIGGPGLGVAELDNSASYCVKALEDPVSSVRDAFAEALGAVIALGMNPEAHVQARGKGHFPLRNLNGVCGGT